MTLSPNFGRPQDKNIQKDFMKKIRGDKLQAINAECQLQICLAFKYGQKPKNKKNNRKSKNKENQQNNQSIANRVINMIIGELQIDRRTMLLQNFQHVTKLWMFEQIEQDKPLPQYFFDDGYDLSFVIHELQKTGKPQFNKFAAEDLIFLQLLCLQGRKLLNEDIITYYENNIGFMVQAMKCGLQKIQEKLKMYKHKNSLKGKQRKTSQQDVIACQNINSIEILQIKQIVKEKEQKKNQNNCQKQMSSQQIGKKQRKNKKKLSKSGQINKKNNKSSDQDSQQEYSESEQEKYPQGKQLALKTCNYISWAYWYVINKQ